jgi:hypothetical protein
MPQRLLHELIDTVDPAWPIVQSWLAEARNEVEILPADRVSAEKTLLYLQVTIRSPMGALAFETGGLLIDHGWLRCLGAGHERISGNLRTWNSSGDLLSQSDLLHGALVVAYDVLGGFFALNGGAFPGKSGHVFYFAPDTLKWEDTEKSYSELLEWALGGDLALFYQGQRWPNWQQDISALSGDQAISIYPFLFTDKDLPIIERSRRPVPIVELWKLYMDLAHQLGSLPPGTPIRIAFTQEPPDKI